MASTSTLFTNTRPANTKERSRSQSPTRIFPRRLSDMLSITTTTSRESTSSKPQVKTLEWPFSSSFAFDKAILKTSRERGDVWDNELAKTYVQGLTVRTTQQKFRDLYVRHQDTVTNIDFDFTPAPECIRLPPGAYHHDSHHHNDDDLWWFSTWLNNDEVRHKLLEKQVFHFCGAITSTAKLLQTDNDRELTFRITGQYGSRSKPTVEKMIHACAQRGVVVEFAGEWVRPRGRSISDYNSDSSTEKRRGLRSVIRHRFNQVKFIRQFL